MFVSVEYDRGSGWQYDENTANLIPALREVIDDKDLGKLAMCYIALGTDPASAIADTFEEVNERLDEASKMVFTDEKIRKKTMSNKKVIAAIAIYKKFSNTRSIKIKESYQKGVERLAKYIDGKDGNLKEEDIGNVMKVIEKMPSMMQAFDETRNAKKSDTNHTKSRVKGDRALGLRAQKYSIKKKK